MKNKADHDFRLFRMKIFTRTIAMLAIAVVSLYLVYSFLLHGNFANWMTSLFQYIFGMDHDAAANLYQRTFRRYRDIFIWLFILFELLSFFYLHLRQLTKYFEEINGGLDVLLQDAPAEISLPSELLSLERKMNQAKRTMERQKSGMLMTEQRKNDLIMYLAHDLKTPLASSVSYLHLLKDEKHISEELREKYLAISLAKAERLEDLINEFLEIAKYNLSNITLQYSEVNLTRLLEQLAFEMQPILDKKNLTCRLETTDDIMLKCDADKMQRVFDNLLRNAAIYSYEKTEITIAAEEGDGCLTIKFLNHGITIPKEKLERIFEQFYRLGTDAGADGAGLGLAVAKQIVALHEGTVTAASENGLTVFTVTLPVL